MEWMTKRPRKPRKKRAPPRSREEGAIRIGRYVRWLYGSETPPATLAEPLIDAAFDEIAAVEDEDRRKALLSEALERAYAGISAD